MKVNDYLNNVLVPANVAVSAMRRAGIPIDKKRLTETKERWTKELLRLEGIVEDAAVKAGTPFKYSSEHSVHFSKIGKFLYNGLGLKPLAGNKTDLVLTDGGSYSTDAEALQHYASITVPRPDDHPIVTAVLKIRSLAKGLNTFLDGLERTQRADGACHPKFNWAAVKTARLSAEDPPVHQLPERSDKDVAEGVKAVIVPRCCPAVDREKWDPRIHGSVFRWDISGAEATIRCAMFTKYYGVTDPIAYDYIRLGKDIHSKTASLVYQKPEGTFKKGDYERDSVGKPVLFAGIFGATWKAIQYQMWKEARNWIPDDEMKKIKTLFDEGYSGVTQLYSIDKDMLGERMDGDGRSWIEDAYGRRRSVLLPGAMKGRWSSQRGWELQDVLNPWASLPRGTKLPQDDPRLKRRSAVNNAFHIAANTPTQSTNASDALWMIAMLHGGEYVPLAVPPMWESLGFCFPEAADWQMNGGNGPGGKPFQAWHFNTVHDSGWGDCAPGQWIEHTAKVIWRRCHALPLDLRIETDVPYRVDLKVGPNMGDLRDYNKVAAEFGFEPMPKR